MSEEIDISDEEALANHDPEADLEEVYDREIMPLASAINRACRRAGIPFIGLFNFAPLRIATFLYVPKHSTPMFQDIAQALDDTDGDDVGPGSN